MPVCMHINGVCCKDNTIVFSLKIWGTLLCSLEEETFLLIIFFTSCRDKSGFVASIIILKGCFSYSLPHCPFIPSNKMSQVLAK